MRTSPDSPDPSKLISIPARCSSIEAEMPVELISILAGPSPDEVESSRFGRPSPSKSQLESGRTVPKLANAIPTSADPNIRLLRPGIG